MEDEIIIKKRNTDCVYYLASPLTCKKGNECEYRHSEAARLNHTDCYFWLAGNCKNLICAFRHPPLDGCSETSVELTPLSQQPSVPVPSLSKANVPCYFYFKGFCNKGDSCSFLHGPAPTTGVTKPIINPSKNISKSAIAYRQENGQLTVTSKFQTSTEPPNINPSPSPSPSLSPSPSPLSPSPSPTTLNVVERTESPVNSDSPQSLDYHNKIENPIPVFNLVEEQNPSPQPTLLEFGEIVFNSETSFPEDDFVTGGFLPGSCGEQVDGSIDSEEISESSVGFDVLVDNGSEMGFKDGPEYLVDHERDLLQQYDFEGSDCYDLVDYLDKEIPYKHELYNDGGISDYVQRVPRGSREMLLDPMSEWRNVRVDERSSSDLRDYIGKRKRYEGSRQSHNSGRNISPRPLHRSYFENDRRSSGFSIHSRDSRKPSHSKRKRNKPRLPREKKAPTQHARATSFDSSEILPRGAPFRDARSTQVFTSFSGPKTLAQIKEEKQNARNQEEGGSGIKRSHEDDYGIERSHFIKTPSGVFAGPKPLNEILKEKRACTAK